VGANHAQYQQQLVSDSRHSATSVGANARTSLAVQQQANMKSEEVEQVDFVFEYLQAVYCPCGSVRYAVICGQHTTLRKMCYGSDYEISYFWIYISLVHITTIESFQSSCLYVRANNPTSAHL
jgi:hypothetical protein